ncbi:hypothetical protein XHV734_4806 [Xanthomonas hortorum pv. vitians]|nr:hypothetical protein XHV734_4806 [Xanthomonas hortorum pv. vitians]
MRSRRFADLQRDTGGQVNTELSTTEGPQQGGRRSQDQCGETICRVIDEGASRVTQRKTEASSPPLSRIRGIVLTAVGIPR